MNYSLILEHALEVTARHRALWVLGFLWALVGGCGGGGGGSGFNLGGGGSGGGGSSGSTDFEVPEAMRQMGERLGQLSPAQWIGIAVGAACVVLALAIISTVARYVLQAGIFRSLDQLDAVGLEPTVRGAWTEGWNRRTVRLVLQDLAVGLGMLALVLITLLPMVIPVIFIAASADSNGLGPVGALGVMGLVSYCCLWVIALIVISNVVEVLQQLWWRYAVLDDQDFIAAVQLGIRLGRSRARPLVGMWLVMLLVGLLWMLVSLGLVVGFGLLTALVAGGPAWLLYHNTDGLTWPLVWGIPVGVLTFIVPLVFAAGLYLVFQASVWTQVFRQLAGGAPAAALEPAPAGWPEPLA